MHMNEWMNVIQTHCLFLLSSMQVLVKLLCVVHLEIQRIQTFNCVTPFQLYVILDVLPLIPYCR